MIFSSIVLQSENSASHASLYAQCNVISPCRTNYQPHFHPMTPPPASIPPPVTDNPRPTTPLPPAPTSTLSSNPNTSLPLPTSCIFNPNSIEHQPSPPTTASFSPPPRDSPSWPGSKESRALTPPASSSPSEVQKDPTTQHSTATRTNAGHRVLALRIPNRYHSLGMAQPRISRA